MLRVVIALLLSSRVIALSTTASSEIFTGLQSVPLIRASDALPTPITSSWRQNTPFGLGDETVVCAFLRHFG